MPIMEGVTWLFVLLFILLIGPLAVFFGADSRLPRDRRSF
jgi:hypothetical protein